MCIRDRPWDGAVCDDPLGNSSCTLLANIGRNRDDEFEATHASKEMAGLDSDRLPGAAVREPSTVSARAVDKMVREDEAWVSAVVPTGTGVLLAVRR